MATRKTVPAIETPREEEAPMVLPEMQNNEQLAAMKAEIERLKKQNEELQKNSVYSPSPYGSEGDYARVQKACEDAAKAGEDPWNITISVKAPRIGKGEDSYWLSVNGRTMQVPANEKYYELALPFAQCLVDEIQNRNAANDFVDSIENYDPVTNPKAMK